MRTIFVRIAPPPCSLIVAVGVSAYIGQGGTM
jgi:hypothetical protein